MGTYLTVTERFDKFSCGFYSENEPLQFEIGGSRLQKKQDNWVDYPLGVLNEFLNRGFNVSGYDFHFRGNLPIGASLSSSASIEMATAYALNELCGAPFSMLELVQMAQHAENVFVGMNCGIMDQFACGFGKRNQALVLDCNTLQHEWVSLEMRGLKFVIANSNKKRGLVDSVYNLRRSECQNALDILQKELPVKTLCEMSVKQFNEMQSLLSGDVLRRARHAVYEHARVKEAIHALENHNMFRFGQLLNESHTSLRDDYAVSCPELDFLVDAALHFDGVLGSRMTGAGFGGCTVTLIAENRVQEFIHTVGSAYEQNFHLKADFYVPNIGDGVRVLQ